MDFGLNNIVETVSSAMCFVIRTFLLNPVALVIAVGMVIQWYRNTVQDSENYIHKPLARTFGLAMIVLQFWQSEYLERFIKGYELTATLWLVVVESILSIIVAAFAMNFDKTPKQSLKKLFVENRYQNVNVPFRIMLLYFWVQGALMTYFLYYVNNDEKVHYRGKHQEHKFSTLKWIIAVNLTQIAGEKEAGRIFHFSYWASLWKLKDGTNQDKILGCIPCPYWLQLRLRAICDFLVNALFRIIIMAVAPVELAVQDDLEFIKDALAIFFITKLDNYEDPKKFEDIFLDEIWDMDMKERLQRLKKEVDALETTKSDEETPFNSRDDM